MVTPTGVSRIVFPTSRLRLHGISKIERVTGNGAKWAEGQILVHAWDDSPRPEWMVHLLEHWGLDRRRLTELVCDLVETVNELLSPSALEAIRIARACARGEATADEARRAGELADDSVRWMLKIIKGCEDCGKTGTPSEFALFAIDGAYAAALTAGGCEYKAERASYCPAYAVPPEDRDKKRAELARIVRIAVPRREAEELCLASGPNHESLVDRTAWHKKGALANDAAP